ncbi:sensor histidine kinase [Alteromonas flava]|uniref:sensor histidine kinase n=1 Tax=Alteromonas flava TaxID=2048003 RepID=UPI000C289A26|nr:HAMP domain-containing sensor histidine kinase [Alteromonas flava]
MQLGSLRQLTLISFVVALIPLVALLWQSQKDLADVALMTAEDNRFVVEMVSAMRNLENDAVDIERLTRQYQVVQNDTLITLLNNRYDTFNRDLDTICNAVVGIDCQSMYAHIKALSQNLGDEPTPKLERQLTQFNLDIAALEQAVRSAINRRIAQQQDTLKAIKQKQAWSTALLAALSLSLVIVGSQLIVHPFKKLKAVIKAIAQQAPELPPISQNSPRELIAIEHDLHWLAERLEQLEHLRTALLRHASHELKTPLASIKEGCSLLSEEVVGKLNSSQREVIDLLLSSTDRLNSLVEGLLNYNLLLQQAQPVIKRVNIDTIVTGCLTDNALALQQNGHQVDVQLEVATIDVDEALYRRILDNLLSNAIAHGTPQTTIKLHVYSAENYAVLDVANSGQTIPVDQRVSLFEPFIRGPGTRNDKVIGAGLGLSIVADCARLMHGYVSIVNVDYADVCFRVAIPMLSGSEK